MGKMTWLLGLLGANKSIFLFVLANKLNSNLEVKESITPKVHKKTICTHRLGERFFNVGKSVSTKTSNQNENVLMRQM
jgi:hypothetical protein